MHTHVQLNQPFLPSPQERCFGRGWQAQFACPNGRLGALVGHLMAFKNERMNRFAVEMLAVQPADQILEIGFGHGRALQLLAERAPEGLVAGLDLSATMVEQAARRNRAFIKAGRVEVQQGTVMNLPYEYGRFDKIVAVNNYQFWPEPEYALNEIRRVLRAGGLLALCLRLHSASRLALAPGFTEEEVEEVKGLVRWVGFQNVRVVRRKLGREAVCILAQR